MTTPYVKLANALAASSSSLGGQHRLSSLGAQAIALPLLAAPALSPAALALSPAAAALSPAAAPLSPVAAALSPAAPALSPRLSAPSDAPRFAPIPVPPAALVPAPSAVPVQSVAMQAMLNAAGSDLREIRNDTRRRLDRSFYASLGLGVLGGLALLTGVGLAFAQAVPIGITSGIGGAVSSFFSGIFLRLYRAEGAELRRLVGDLQRVEDARLGLWLADQIQDATQRDAAIGELIVRIQRARNA